MAIHDRGKIKWQSAFFMPEHVKMLKDMERDLMKSRKPILDQYEIEDMENRIHLEMEYAKDVHIQTWNEGFVLDYKGFINRLDALEKVIYLKGTNDIFEKIRFTEVIKLEIC